MKILVCGSEGSLMQSVIPKLLEKGHEVTGVDNLSRYGVRPGHAKDYQFIKADLVDYSTCQSVTYDADVIINAAATIYGVAGFHNYCADILGRDVTLHTNLLRCAVQREIERFVFISSSMVYERCSTSSETLLDDPSKYAMPVTDYGLSKYMGERLCRAYQKQYGVPYTIWRPFNIITPYEKVTTDDIGTSHVFADYINNIIHKRLNPLPIIGDGKQVRCFTWIEDVAQAIADYSLSPRTENEHFNLGTTEFVTMRNLARGIFDIACSKGIIPFTSDIEFETVKEYDADVRVRIPEVDKANTVLNWRATTKLKDSLERCINA